MGEISNTSGISAGIDVSSTNFTAVTVDAGGSVLRRFSTPIDRSSESVPQLAAFAASLKEHIGDFETLGVSVPGLVNRKMNRVEYSTEFPEHSKNDLAGAISDAASVSARIENDANAGAFGEFTVGAGKGSTDMFYATLGSGIGGSLIIGGEIWRGGSGFAGEFGYMAINSDGIRLEDVASSGNIVRRTRSRFHQDSTSVLSKLDEDQITIHAIVDAAAKEDDFAILMLERTGIYIGSAIASVINLLNIEQIVLGGEIMKAGAVVLEAISRRAKELSFGPAFANTNIRAGVLGDEAAAIGVALLARQSG